MATATGGAAVDGSRLTDRLAVLAKTLWVQAQGALRNKRNNSWPSGEGECCKHRICFSC